MGRRGAGSMADCSERTRLALARGIVQECTMR